MIEVARDCRLGKDIHHWEHRRQKNQDKKAIDHKGHRALRFTEKIWG